MPISAVEYAILEQVREQNALPPQPTVLELGHSNWYGDVPLERLRNDIARFVSDPDRRVQLEEQLRTLEVMPARDERLYGLARLFWEVMVDPQELVSIDLMDKYGATPIDLNKPFSLDKQFDMVLNSGTAEHVFNVLQLFQSVHELTRPGGIMIHGAPLSGFFDHGFYCFQPTFWWDLAAANGYAVAGMIYAELTPIRILTLHNREQLLDMAATGKIGANSMLYPIFRKNATESPFRTPMQGYYAGTVSVAVQSAWQDNR